MPIIDANGYLTETELWNEKVALQLASYENIKKLTAEHWEVIYFIRDYYADFQTIPSIQKICAFKRGKTLELYGLFPKGPIKSACRIAGIPQDSILQTKT